MTIDYLQIGGASLGFPVVRLYLHLDAVKDQLALLCHSAELHSVPLAVVHPDVGGKVGGAGATIEAVHQPAALHKQGNEVRLSFLVDHHEDQALWTTRLELKREPVLIHHHVRKVFLDIFNVAASLGAEAETRVDVEIWVKSRGDWEAAAALGVARLTELNIWEDLARVVFWSCLWGWRQDVSPRRLRGCHLDNLLHIAVAEGGSGYRGFCLPVNVLLQENQIPNATDVGALVRCHPRHQVHIIRDAPKEGLVSGVGQKWQVCNFPGLVLKEVVDLKIVLGKWL